MKVYVYPADAQGCGFYRLIWPARAVRKLGHDVTIIMPRQRGNSLRAEIRNDHVVDVSYPKDADVIVLQRITHKYLIEAIKLMSQDVAVVIDMDDDLSTIDSYNPAWKAMHPRYGHNPHHNWNNAQKACDVATFVTVSTNALLPRYVRHGKGTVIRNCIPQRYLMIEHNDSNILGWGGALHVHPSDVKMLGHSVATLTREGYKFKVIGPEDGVATALCCDALSIEATGTVDLHTEWPYALSSLGVGVAPLADTVFNKAKSHLKILEYSSLGVPWIASPRDEYRRAHEIYGVGLLANKPKHWLRYMRELITDDIKRRELIDSGRAWAESMTIEGNAYLWANAWRIAANM